jgi:hypothetical protein
MVEKFIRTYYDDEKVIMKISGCQFCPLMRFDKDRRVCLCRYFKNSFGDNTVDVFVIGYTEKGVVEDKIKIPAWCKLPYTLDGLHSDRTTYRAFPSTILINAEDDCDDSKLPIIDAQAKKNEEDILLENFMIQLSKKPDDFVSGESKNINIHDNSFSNNGINYTRYDDEYEGYGYQTAVRKNGTCSLCGNEDETVKRDKNIGMCDTCWGEHKDDDEQKKRAFVNNFRMKRDKDFPKEQFKLIDEINIG